MWWYSANNIPFVSKNGKQAFFDESIYRQSNINRNYVWSEQQIEFVSAITGVESEDLGSLVFYLMEPPIFTRSQNPFTLTIFDVTPFSQTGEDEFYSFSVCSNFLLDLLKIVKDLEKELNIQIRIQIKSKRERSEKHDERYFDLLHSLVNDYSIVLVSENANLYNLIFDSDLVVSIPFTSPALIARELRVPSCYFSENYRFDLPNFRDGVPTFNSAESLSIFFRKVLATYA
jgi:polysaccharide biosynthesis PFTS motif protein